MNIDDDTFSTIDELLKFFAYKFPFGIHDSDDIYQQGWVYALEALKSGRYSENRGTLKSFLFSVLYSRFINFKRNEHYRPETPCKSCPFAKKGNCCDVFEVLSECPLYGDWERRNAAKKSISCASVEITPDHAARPFGEIDLEEFPPHLREIALRASTGEKLSKVEKNLLREHLRDN